ncbi:motility associated factor glycosyltransferase family protein [Clostridium sp. ZS2-4]|uniref:motility associated factor glycosyltransferase family protein n=1 Tax=Clostridium sp. ZS2-4 TaxID=2987703 RepID=UPI00227B0946|nr:6-hydroxymethylpterin diphosphokinase MptE-like protein [Clostridium sp. ZS2-4]MCY6353972.1 DUF115 domain-containing protein [Clostridium sp. ZS2-4]
MSKTLRKITIIETKEMVPTLKINNKFIHSKYYPQKDAKTFIDNNTVVYKQKQHVLLYGIGMGYHVKELLTRIDKECKVYIFDADEEVFNIVDKLNLLTDIKKDSRVELFIGYSKEFMDKFHEKLQLVDDILVYNPSIEALSESMERFKLALKNFSVSRMGMSSFKELADKNYENNIKEKHEPIEKFFEIKNLKSKPVIIVSSGPSLDYSVKYLSDFKEDVQIFAAGSALKTLMNNGITPDMICIIDADRIIANQVKGYENLNVPLCFLSTASHEAVDSYKGPKYIFYNEPCEDRIVIDTGKSVATAILDIAIKGEANPIIFIGQDLAFVDNKTHAEAYSEVHHLNIAVPIKKQYQKVIGVNGELLNTNNSLLYFKNWIENKINEYPNITFINCSKGAKIKGTVDMELKDVYKLITSNLKDKK